MEFFDDKTKKSFAFAAKFVGGVVLVSVLANLTLWLDVHFGIVRSEMSFTENAQLVFLALTIFNFLRFAREERALRHAAVLIAGFFAAAFVRECDGALDLIHHGCWVVPAGAVSLAAIIYAARDVRGCVRELAEIFQSPGLMAVGGVVILLVYSRLFGMGVFWEKLMQDGYMRDVKTVAEEGSELVAYGVIWLASVFTRIEFRQRREAKSCEK